MNKAIIGFVVGAALAALTLYVTVIANLQAQNRGISAQQQLQSGDLQKQVSSLQGQVQTLTTQRDTCVSRFGRVTLLYDIGLLGGETRAWAIPADVEPRVFGIKRGTFSHYDPKTQTETVHLAPTVTK